MPSISRYQRGAGVSQSALAEVEESAEYRRSCFSCAPFVTLERSLRRDYEGVASYYLAIALLYDADASPGRSSSFTS